MDALVVDPLGRLVGDSLDEYELMLQAYGAVGISNSLVARAKNRDDSINAWKGMTIAVHLLPVALAPRIYAACESLLLSGDADKIDNGALWVAQLKTGVSDVLQCSRLLMAGQPVGAAAMARFWLDRWTMNLARTTNVRRDATENTGAYYRRVWSRHPELGHNIGSAWKDLSDLLHGVGSLAPLLVWNGTTEDLLSNQEVGASVHVIGRALKAILVHIEKSLLLHAIRVDRQDVAELLAAPAPGIDVSHRPEHIGPAFWPITPHLLASNSATFVQVGAEEWNAARAMFAKAAYVQTNRDTWNCFLFDRAQVMDKERYSYGMEAEILKDSFAPDSVAAKLGTMILVTEMAEVCAGWDIPSRAATGLRLSAGALRSAFTLWAEDDNLSLMCLRSAIQGMAYCRVAITKPETASRLMDGNRPAAQWVRKAGWARLDAFTEALAEFSHIGKLSRYPAAFAMLNDLQAEDWEHRSPLTARGHAVFAVLALAAEQVSNVVGTVSPHLADAFDRSVAADQWAPSGDIKEWMDRLSKFKGAGLGEPDKVWLPFLPDRRLPL